jgi:hypothetical protein
MRMTMYLYSKALVCIIAVLFSIQSWSSPPRAERDLSGYTPVQIKLNSYAALPIEQEVKFFETMDAEADDQKIKTFYIIGGMRLKLSLSESIIGPVELNQQATYTWSIIENGTASNVACASLNITEACDLTLNTITGPELYWQPKDWSLGLNAVGTIKVSYPEASQYPEQTIKFKIANRVIGPAMVESEGSDIKMLEQMLWQLGISGQEIYYGKSGARIASDRNGNDTPVKTYSCGGTAKVSKREKYYAGFSNCVKGQVSTELMIRRFQGRNVSAKADAKTNRGNGQTGIVNSQTLSDLKRVWIPYLQAVSSYADSKILNSEVTEDWLTQALSIWDSGLGTQANKTYIQSEHDNMLKAAGLASGSKSRTDLLRSWKANETTSHWGEGSPRTAYRMTEGAADPFGSMSFNQILYQYRYSRSPCKGHEDAGLNYFDPIGNLKGFALHTALKPSSGQNCPGSFYLAYDLKQFTNTHGAAKPAKFFHQSGQLKDLALKDDEYEVFAKAVAGYNGSLGFWDNGTWAYLLSKTKKPTQAEKNKGTFVNSEGKSCVSCEYSINVRNVKYGLPYRTYVWEGAKGKDLNGDGTINNEPANPSAVPPTPEYKEEGWCFAYGEKEWMDGDKFTDVKNLARGSLDAPALGRINCSTGAAL